MRFSIGDILLKVDTRPTSDTMASIHHVMLIVGESDGGFPIVIHMLGFEHKKLIKEELTRGNYLNLMVFNWPDTVKNKIAEIAEEALGSGKFILNKEIIRQHADAVRPYRPDCTLDAQNKYLMLQKAFTNVQSAKETFNPQPAIDKVMSCHEWVVSVLHLACETTDTPIPKCLHILPHLAWADRLHYAAQQDQTVSLHTVSISTDSVFFHPAEAQRMSSSSRRHSFWGRNKTTSDNSGVTSQHTPL